MQIHIAGPGSEDIMNNNKQELMRSIRKCSKCHSGVYTPFYFPMKDQEVMVISAAPSMQAMYKPLTSIRFFRRLCLALFGDKYLREKGLCENYLYEFCGGNIYWTHYYKCFSPSLTDFTKISDVCADIYLKKEIEVLKPKLILVFGDAIREKVKLIVSDEINKCIFKPFPDTGAEAIFDEVREKIETHLKLVKKTGLANKAIYRSQVNSIQRNEVHLRFEFAAYEKMFQEKLLNTPLESIEEIWHKNLVVPNIKRYSKLVSAYSFIENQVQVFLLDYMARTHNYTIFKKMRNNYQNPSWESVFKVIKEGPVNELMLDFIKYKSINYFNYYKDQFKEQLNTLRLIRNQIVHDGGFIYARKTVKGNIIDNCLYHPDDLEPFPGIFIFANTIYISQKGEENILQFVKEIVDLLCKLQ